MERFAVQRSDTGTVRPWWYVRDTTTGRDQGGPYQLKRQAAAMAARWNADPDLAEQEAPRRPGA